MKLWKLGLAALALLLSALPVRAQCYSSYSYRSYPTYYSSYSYPTYSSYTPSYYTPNYCSTPTYSYPASSILVAAGYPAVALNTFGQLGALSPLSQSGLASQVGPWMPTSASVWLTRPAPGSSSQIHRI